MSYPSQYQLANEIIPFGFLKRSNVSNICFTAQITKKCFLIEKFSNKKKRNETSVSIQCIAINYFIIILIISDFHSRRALNQELFRSKRK